MGVVNVRRVDSPIRAQTRSILDSTFDTFLHQRAIQPSVQLAQPVRGAAGPGPTIFQRIHSLIILQPHKLATIAREQLDRKIARKVHDSAGTKFSRIWIV